MEHRKCDRNNERTHYRDKTSTRGKQTQRIETGGRDKDCNMRQSQRKEICVLDKSRDMWQRPEDIDIWLRQEQKHLADTMTGTCERYNKKVHVAETRTYIFGRDKDRCGRDRDRHVAEM